LRYQFGQLLSVASDGVVDPALKHFQLPFRFVFGDDAECARPFLQGLVAHQTVESRFEYAPGESVESEWETWGFSLSGGYDIPLSEHLSLLPVLSVGYGSLSHHCIESVNAPSEFVDFRGRVSAFDLAISTVHPTPWELFDNPLSIVGLLGNTQIFGPERDVLGFDSFSRLARESISTFRREGDLRARR